jgi:hypothetical protein
MVQAPWSFTGSSAMTLYAIHNGHSVENNTPLDPSDWARCVQVLRLLFKDDELAKKRHIERVAELFECPIWSAFGEHYDELMRVFESEMHDNFAPGTYEYMQWLRGEAS